MKINDEYKELAWQGLWKNNPGIVQLLGLCPLLAVTSTLTNAIGLGLATLFVLICSNTTVSAIRKWVPKEIRIPIFVLIIASFVTCVQLLMNAYTFGLYQSLGIFLPLIVTNCAIIGRAEAYASKNPIKQASFDGLMMGLGFLLILMLLGAVREILGQGTLFDGANLLLGEWASILRIEVYTLDSQFLLAILPPGAFIVMGLFIALKNAIDDRVAAAKPKTESKEIERVRVNFDEK
ncbi:MULTISPECIES: electron transport complex subunit E [unclassified Colwellia]|uniref:electron transport complex subunit E n=1 Tax=unclassified Colwellia TaxID=196834 RepID=UPI0015F3F248|nr:MULTISPECIES: electron transport complex subunit E [unclassified Colwellia]MBA6362903.1 electron transport complex subunit E [Colwellia sp. BRX8-8]MBA6348953.1 electron transport complex subunit E [Colwellia sp. BRX8-9]MBA6355900.1 electron transport complex subunit E [Colwellia sp. BRX8-3]MBA6360736.1 electron transport complex subunit E [Colwellia sp. BRX8-6]MBA6368814.1 electron transport complex subunit E [Colwellia sp. BRX8-5]|tara:strand:- start:3221 stop:3928 length:708 start_codon:yes stop_codon:yes gene_type:complete